ncbi:MAG: hypothetical protein UT42_C0042G0005 [Candidatus Falkowbacteria bacterium GW2011_GWA2_39_24]|uniref:Uncharacterized protein n=1 Tax=Candidatus Falkowbacteria bacterium GW2011_GWA2_39_24 TaxID=1618634 RepID=A0A0G0QTJ5_9BACT|nr:MAG: hypothetical protein UT42_C0042G0005 [Candidatus Falkowbacteria bacterium GW2011_GWA2_39_24]
MNSPVKTDVTDLTAEEISNLKNKLESADRNLFCCNNRSGLRVFKALWDRNILVPGQTRLAFAADAINDNAYVVTRDGSLMQKDQKVVETEKIFSQYDKRSVFVYIIDFAEDFAKKI